LRTICPSCLATVRVQSRHVSCPRCGKPLDVALQSTNTISPNRANAAALDLEESDSIRVKTHHGIIFKMTDLEMVREWITLGRINRETDLIAVGAGTWTPLSDYPPLAAPTPQVVIREKAQRPIQGQATGPQVDRTRDWSVNPNWVDRFITLTNS